jgi:hypothetical protein
MAKAIKVFDVATGSNKLGKEMVAVAQGGVTIMDTNTTQTATNKTLTSPTITGATSTDGTFTTATLATPTLTNATLGVFHQNLTALGSSISDAAAVNSTAGSVLVTGGNNAVGVQMPVASAGRIIFLKNADASNGILKVYPQVNSTINALSANTSLDMAAKTSAVFVGTSATNWVTIPLLPS